MDSVAFANNLPHSCRVCCDSLAMLNRDCLIASSMPPKRERLEETDEENKNKGQKPNSALSYSEQLQLYWRWRQNELWRNRQEQIQGACCALQNI